MSLPLPFDAAAVLDAVPSSSSSRKRPRIADTEEGAEIFEDRSLGEGSSLGSTTSATLGFNAATRDMEADLARDDTYYMFDGSCILRVQNRLFNVHRSILSKDGSSFSGMFAMPQGSNQEEGTSDDNPVVLTGDTVAEFRNFLWALYALPHELMVVHSAQADLAQLIDIARVANKYSFKSLETWALDAIQEFVNLKPSPLLTSIPISSATPPSALSASGAQLTRLVRLAQMCAHERLLNTMVALLRQLMGLSLQYAYLAITLADELDLRALRGAAYLEVMQKATVAVARPREVIADDDEDDEDEDDDDDVLHPGEITEDGRLVVTPAQQLRLLSGYYKLTSAWERLRAKPPTFEHATSCGATWHQHGCTQSWLEFWKEKTRSDAVLALGLADVLGRLRAIAKEFDRWGSATYMHHDCRMAARRTIQDKVKGIEDALPDYFSDGGLVG